jgi:hypothetical protein
VDVPDPAEEHDRIDAFDERKSAAGIPLAASDDPDDLRALQTAIAKTLFRFYEMGRAATRPDDCPD